MEENIVMFSTDLPMSFQLQWTPGECECVFSWMGEEKKFTDLPKGRRVMVGAGRIQVSNCRVPEPGAQAGFKHTGTDLKKSFSSLDIVGGKDFHL